MHGDQATSFTRRELLAIRPMDIKRFVGLLACNDPDCNVFPPVNRRPIRCRSSTLEAAKKGTSCHMPHQTVPWCDNQGNPTRCGPVNDIVKEVKKLEVRGEGSPSKAKRPVRPNEFQKAIETLQREPNFDCKCKHPMVCI